MSTHRAPTHRANTLAKGMNFKRAGFALTAAFGAVGILASTAVSASAAPTAVANVTGAASVTAGVMPQGVFKGRASDDLFYSNGQGQFEKLTFDSWKRIGFPKPAVLANSQVLFLRYGFSPNVYQVIQFGPNNYSVSPVNHSGWIAAGAPTPTVAKYIPGAKVEKYQVNDDLFFTEPNGARMKLTMQTWAQTGYMGYSTIANQGYQRLTWDSKVAFMNDVAKGQGYGIDFTQWASAGAPTPQQVRRFPGDQVYRYANSDVVHYKGPTANRTITFNEWVAMGAPAPEVRAALADSTTSDLSKHAVVDLSDQKVYAYNNGMLMKTFTVTTGKTGYATPVGVGKVWHKTASQTMTGGSRAKGTYYSVPNVQWVSYFNGDIAFHAAYWRSEFGGDPSVVGSHGCINMRTEDAKWMYDFATYGTKVVVRQ